MRELKAENDKKQKKDAEKKKAKRTSMARATAMETPKAANTEEEDMGVVGAEADDAEAEFIRTVCEKEVLYGGSLLAAMCPLISSICSNPSKFPDPDLRASASLALSKFMLVSSEFCEQNLQLVSLNDGILFLAIKFLFLFQLFTVLERSVEPVIRANLIIALGDMSFR